MNGIWLEDGKVTLREDIPLPDVEGREALVRLRMAGICSTDLELIGGYYPYTGVLGHEFVGQVEEAPSHPDLTDARVVGEINAVCGECVHCRNGRSRHCLQRTVLGISGRDGVFAEYFTLPVENLYPVPDAIPDSAAVFVEPLAAALEITQQTHIRPSDEVIVVGAGRLGQLISQVFVLTGCDLKVVARYEHQRELLLEQGIRPITEDDIPQARADLVVDATGAPGGFEAARKAVRPRGRMVLKSTYAGELSFDASALVVDEITLIGSRCGPFPPALRLLEEKLVQPEKLIDRVFPLGEGVEALETAQRQGVIKVLLKNG